jgi:hypothetical protein
MTKVTGILLSLIISINSAFAVDEVAAVWLECQTEHFHIQHQGQADAANHAVAGLERLRADFIAHFTAHGYTLTDRPAPLEWKWFRTRTDFDRYTMEEDAAHLPHLAEYYSSRTNRVALYWPRESEISRDSRRRMAHEAAHQLAFNLGLHKRGTIVPLWLAEGLAMHCETMLHDDDEAATPEAIPVNAMRARMLEQAVASEELLPLKEMIELTDWNGLERVSREAFYAQSWSLFEYLWSERPDAMQRFINDHAALDWGSRSPATLMRHFAEVFGPLETVEAQWSASLPANVPEPSAVQMIAHNRTDRSSAR